MDKHPNAIWAPLDKNERQPARICPKRFYFELKTAFLEDPKHYQIIHSTNVDESEFVKNHFSKKLNPKWLKYTWKSKPKLLAYFYLSFKTDGVRVRPIGSYALVPHKKLLSYNATGIHTIVKFSGSKNFEFTTTLKFKDKVKDFEDRAKANNFDIHKDTFDVKSFFTEVQKTHTLHRLKFFIALYIKNNKTNLVSIPKSKHTKHKPHPGSDTTGLFITFHIDDLFDIVKFAMENAYFKLGHFIIQQIDGLPMGDPLSPALAVVYLAYDEHAFSLSKPISDCITLIIRYVDDIVRFIAYKRGDEYLISFIDCLITNKIYEHDICHKNIEIVQDFNVSNKFLDMNIIVYNNLKNIKLTYFNKNQSVTKILAQEVGRFFNVHDYMSIQVKLSAFVAILVRAIDACTFPLDCTLPFCEVMMEMHILGYSERLMLSAITKAARIRKNDLLWDFISAKIKYIFYSLAPFSQ